LGIISRVSLKANPSQLYFGRLGGKLGEETPRNYFFPTHSKKKTFFQLFSNFPKHKRKAGKGGWKGLEKGFLNLNSPEGKEKEGLFPGLPSNFLYLFFFWGATHKTLWVCGFFSFPHLFFYRGGDHTPPFFLFLSFFF